MRLRSLVEGWTKEEVNKVWSPIQRLATETGFEAQIVGSIATEGYSDKDLDILLTPADDDFDYEAFMEGMNQLGIYWHGNASDEMNELDTFHTSDGKIIDVFIGDYEQDHEM